MTKPHIYRTCLLLALAAWLQALSGPPFASGAEPTFPGATGAQSMADTVRGDGTGGYGTLWLPRVWQTGMVVQRDKPITVKGQADAGALINVTLQGRTASTVADNQGRWSVTAAPLAAGGPYKLSVSNGRSRIDIDDILAGEVWIASGQSNMEFPLSQDTSWDGAVADDPHMRVYDMKPVARTDAVTWGAPVLDRIDSLDHYRPARWGRPTSSFSAVAYHFGRMLRDSLQVPVGIIANPVGGSPTESWIDTNTLARHMPAIFTDWQHNGYLQPWVQQRALQNTGGDLGRRHPYEPSYLYSAGIRQLEGYPLAGAIWYQGESNAHNTELHARLFKLLVQSWREAFGQPRMPFYFVQLSSIERPTWPSFRDSQRRLALSIPDTGMAVSSDLGDPTDVHPTRKAPVGRRLALLALALTYGHTGTECQGPTVTQAVANGDSVTLTLGHARGLHTADGLAPGVFEIASSEGLYLPATATICGNSITLSNQQVSRPRYVRYAWQPYTESNVVNGEGLPMSTFKIETVNAADCGDEPGYGHGPGAP